MIEAYKKFFANYANFNGCSSRADYWWVVLCNFLIGFAIGFVAGLTGIQEITYLSYVYGGCKTRKIPNKCGENNPNAKISFEDIGNNAVRVSGLSAGDIVVTAGVHKLYEGQKIRLMEDK